jgi:hypothetical protein
VKWFSYEEMGEVCPVPHPDHGDQVTVELGDVVAKARSYAVDHGYRCMIGEKARFPLAREVAQNEFRRHFPDQSSNSFGITELCYPTLNRQRRWRSRAACIPRLSRGRDR